jgi:hypothetical protein
MSTAHKVQWPTVFSGLRGSTWANSPSEISAGIVANAVLNLIEVEELREFWHMRRSEF